MKPPALTDYTGQPLGAGLTCEICGAAVVNFADACVVPVNTLCAGQRIIERALRETEEAHG